MVRVFNRQRRGKELENNMKRILLFALSAAILLCAGCASKAVKTLDTQEVANKLLSAVPFADQMSQIESETALQLYGLDESTVAKSAVYESTGATAEEVAVFEAKDEKTAKKVKEAAQKRIENQREGFKDYQPKEMEKLKSPVLVTSGKYVILCVSDQNSTAQKIIDSYIK
ncbi:hypothetical protein CAGA_11530 [Caproiciproducens galactitolivorans]|uniref:DUF4358 domain-containing protein n=2 Tax=Caproiciproducens galactitolivorans TaxID=642589 RepID=A0A4Z0Y2H7_9FIRM|nr:hypothetical protein CAGA_11530 [Caproiciproducens galactitolivorans]